MKKLFFLFIFIFLLSSCGKKVDNEVLENLSTALEERWNYTDTLPKEVSVEELEKAVKIELDNLKKYDYEDFKDGDLFLLYNRYIMDLDLIATLMQGKSADDKSFQRQWEDHMNKRKITLYEINEIHEIVVSKEREDILNKLIAEGKTLYEKQDIYEYVEQMTYRIYEALLYSNGSFEQRSSLAAAENRANSVIEEVYKNIEDEKLIDLFEELRTIINLAVEEGLNDQFVSLEIYAEMMEETAEEIKKY